MTNTEIIQSAAMLKGFEYDGGNLFTFGEWCKIGYTVVKGQKAFMTCRLWKKVVKTNKKTSKTESKFFLLPAYLFTLDQVKKLEPELQLTAK